MMDTFSDFSGLQLKRAKSISVGFGLSTKEASRCAEHLVTPIETLPVRYFSVPLVDRQLRVQDWQLVFDKVDFQIGWMAGAFAIARRPASFGEGSPIRHPDLFYVGLSHAGKGTTPA